MDTGDEYMTTLTGIKDAQYLAQFLGRKIAVKTTRPDVYELYPMLYSIHANRTVTLRDKEEKEYTVSWDELENPYILIQQGIEVILK
jgi:hypothetical protein